MIDLIALLWPLSFLNIQFVVKRIHSSFSCHLLLFRPLMCLRVVRQCGCLRTFLLERRWSRFCRISLDERLGWFLGGFTLLPTSGTVSFFVGTHTEAKALKQMCQEHDLNAFHEQEAALNSHDWDRQTEIDKAKAEALFKQGHLGRKSWEPLASLLRVPFSAFHLLLCTFL